MLSTDTTSGSDLYLKRLTGDVEAGGLRTDGTDGMKAR